MIYTLWKIEENTGISLGHEMSKFFKMKKKSVNPTMYKSNFYTAKYIGKGKY